MHFKRHQARCAADVWAAWLWHHDSIPSREYKRETYYVCIICGMSSTDRKEIAAHLAHHSFTLLQRFNLDVIVSHAPRRFRSLSNLPCLHDPTCKFSINDLDTHRCKQHHCGNSNTRLMYRLGEFNTINVNGWHNDKIAGRN